MTTRTIQAVVAAASMTIGIAGCSTNKEAATPPAAPAAVAAPAPTPHLSGTVGENAVTATAKVKAVNQKTRHVTLERSDGTQIKFVAGDEVRNLKQVKVGDEVKVTYYESLAYEVHKAGTAKPEGAVAEAAGRAPVGDKPGAAAARATTITATIAAIDKAAGTVTLKTPDGEKTTIKARNPDNLNRVSVGDLVELTYTEALGISVETPEKKPSKKAKK